MENEVVTIEKSMVHPVPISAIYTSHTVAMLAGKEKPQEENICAHCVNSNWFTTADETKCYCMGMRVIVWQTHRPTAVTRCDKFADQIPEKE